MAVAFRAAASQAYSGTLTGSITIPGAVVVGDLMLLGVQLADSPVPTMSTPSGWTPVRNDHATAGLERSAIYLFARTATSGDTGGAATVAMVEAGGGRWTAILLAYTDATGTPAVHVSAATGSGSDGTALTAPSVTTTINGCKIVEFFASSNPSAFSAAITPPSTSRATPNAGVVTAGAASDQAQSTAGATGTQSATAANSGSWVATTIAVSPPSAVLLSGSPTITLTAAATLTVPAPVHLSGTAPITITAAGLAPQVPVRLAGTTDVFTGATVSIVADARLTMRVPVVAPPAAVGDVVIVKSNATYPAPTLGPYGRPS